MALPPLAPKKPKVTFAEREASLPPRPVVPPLVLRTVVAAVDAAPRAPRMPCTARPISREALATVVEDRDLPRRPMTSSAKAAQRIYQEALPRRPRHPK